MLPLVFEQNEGQYPAQTYFAGKTQQYTVAVGASDLRFLLPGKAARSTVTLSLQGSTPGRPEGMALAPFRTNSFLGNDPARYRTGIRNYTRIGQSEIYPGVREEFYVQGKNIEHDFILAPNADASQIAIDIRSASEASINKAGEIVIPAAEGSLCLRKPVAYQEAANGSRTEVAAAFVLAQASSKEHGQTLRFHLGAYDHSRRLVIDPVIVYATYVSGTQGSTANSVVSDSTGNVYLAGSTASPLSDFSAQYPTNAYQGTGANTAGFVARFNGSATGSAISWLTYFGGDTGSTVPLSVALQSGSATSYVFVGGTTTASNFPTTTGAFQATANGTTTHGFLMSLAVGDASGVNGGTVFGATYVDSGATGTPADTTINSVASDASGRVVAGGAGSGSTLPVSTNAFTVPVGVLTDGFPTGIVLDLTADMTLTGLDFSTYLSGDQSSNTYIQGVAADASNNIYVGGYTTGDFPMAGVYNTANMNMQTGGNAAFAAQILSPDGNPVAKLGYSAWLDGTALEQVNAATLDASGNLFVFGQTTSTDLLTNTTYTTLASDGVSPTSPAGVLATGVTATAPTKSGGGITTGFVAQLNSTGQPAVMTYLGGAGDDTVTAGAVDADGRVYAAGASTSARQMGYPTSTLLPVEQELSADNVRHGYVAQLAAGLNAVNYFANFGNTGNAADGASGVTVDGSRTVYLSGNVAHATTPYTSGSAYKVVSPATTAASGYLAAIANDPDITHIAQLGLTHTGAHGTPDPIGYVMQGNRSIQYVWTLTSAAPFGPADVMVKIPAAAPLAYSSITLSGQSGNLPCALDSTNTSASCVIVGWPQTTPGVNDTLTLTLTASLTSQPSGSTLGVTAQAFASVPRDTSVSYNAESVSDTITSTVLVPAVLSVAFATVSPSSQSVFVTDSATPAASTQVTYSFTLSNSASGGTATNAALVFTPPSGAGAFQIQSFSATAAGGATIDPGTPCTSTGCTHLTIPASGSIVYSVTGHYPEAALVGSGPTSANQVFSVSASSYLSEPYSQTFTATTTLRRGVHLVLSSRLNAPPNGQAAFNLADTVTYTVSVHNNGPSTSSGSDQVSVTLPSGFVATPGSGYACNTATPAVCTLSAAAIAADGNSPDYPISGTFPDNASNQAILAAAVSNTFAANLALQGDFESASTGTDYTSSQSASVFRTANLAVATSSLTPSATVCGGGTTPCLYMSNNAHLGDSVPYVFTVRNDGPNTSVGTQVTIQLPFVPTDASGTHPLASGTPVTVAAAPGFGTALTCTYTAGTNRIVCSGGNLPLGTSVLSVTGSVSADTRAVPVTTKSTSTAAAPGSVTITQSANGTPAAVTLATLEVDRAAHLVTTKAVAATGTKPSLPINLAESNASQAAGVNDTLTATLRVGDTALNDAPSVVLTDMLPPYFTVTAVPAGVACTLNGAALTANSPTFATTSTLVCSVGTVTAGTATASSGSTPASVTGASAVLTYSGKFVDNGVNPDITGTLPGKVASLTVNIPTAASVTAVAVDPITPSDATSAASTIAVVRSSHVLLRKTRNTTVAVAPAAFADATDPNLDEKTTTTRFGANDEIEYDLAIANGGVNKALGVQFTDTLPPFFTVVSAYAVSGAPLLPDTGANSVPAGQLVAGSFACYAGSSASGTPIAFPFATGAAGQQVTCTYGTAAAPLALTPGASKTGTFDNATSIEVVFQGKYQDNAPGIDNIAAGVSTYQATSRSGEASGAALLAVDNGPATDSVNTALPSYLVQRAAHLRIFGGVTQTTTAEAPLTSGGAGAASIVAQAEPSSTGGTPVFNCLRYKVYVQNVGPNISRAPRLTFTAPSGLNLTSSVSGTTTTPGSDAALASSCTYGSTLANGPVASGSALAPLSQSANATQVLDLDGYFGLNTLTAGNSQTGFVFSYNTLTDPGTMDSARGTFTTVSGAALTVVNTPFGGNFVVTPFTNGTTRPVALTFSSVATPGITSEQVSAAGPALPTGASPDPRSSGIVPLYRTGTKPNFYALGTTAVVNAAPTTVCVTSGVAGSLLPDTFAKPERVLLWALQNLPAGTALKAVPRISAPYTGDVTTSVTPGGLPATQVQPAQVCGQLNGFATAAAPVNVAVLEPVNFAPYFSVNSNPASQTPGKGVSEVSFLLPNVHDYNDSDPCYLGTSLSPVTARQTCDDNPSLTVRVFGGEALIPAQAHTVGPLTIAQAQAQGYVNSSVPLEVQAGATLYELITDTLAEPIYAARRCDPGIASSGSYTPVTNPDPCPVTASSLTGTPPQVTAFGTGQVAQIVPSLNGGSTGLVLLPPAQTPTSTTTPVASGYTTASGSVTAGQTIGFQWDLRSVVPTTGGTYKLSCFGVDTATQNTVTTLPAGLTCQVAATITFQNPKTTNPPANPAIYIVTGQTILAGNSHEQWSGAIGGVVVALLVPFLAMRRRGLSTGRSGLLAALLLTIAGFATLSGCGTGKGATSSTGTTTPAGTYAFRVSAAATDGSGTTYTSSAFTVQVLSGK